MVDRIHRKPLSFFYLEKPCFGNIAYAFLHHLNVSYASHVTVVDYEKF